MNFDWFGPCHPIPAPSLLPIPPKKERKKRKEIRKIAILIRKRGMLSMRVGKMEPNRRNAH